MWWWWGKDWWWWCGFSLISLFFILISWICCFWLSLCYLDFNFFVVVWVLISLFWVLISFLWVFFFFLKFFLIYFFLSYLFWVLICILLWFKPEITQWFQPVQPMTYAIELTRTFGRLRVHISFTWFNRVWCGSTSNPIWPNLWTSLLVMILLLEILLLDVCPQS